MTTSTPSSTPGELTQRQSEVLQVIRNHMEATGAPPTRAEIAKQLGFRSVNAAEDHLKALARKGAIELAPGTSRGIRLSEKHGIGLPIIRDYSSEKPIFSDKHFESRIRIQNECFSQKPDFLLEMKGLSLKEAGIKDGDLLAVCNTSEPQNGQIVIAKVRGKVEIRRYFFEGGQVRLKAEHPDFQDLVLSPQELSVEGVAVGVIRTGSL